MSTVIFAFAFAFVVCHRHHAGGLVDGGRGFMSAIEPQFLWICSCDNQSILLVVIHTLLWATVLGFHT